MKRRLPVAVARVTLVLAVAALAALPARTQTSHRPDLHATDGHPDLQGFWTNATYTPLERPARFAGKEFFTPEEAAAFEKARADEASAQAKNDIHYDNVIWQTEKDRKSVAGLRTSLIVDPPDGKIPPLTDEARRRIAERDRAKQRVGPADGPESRTLAERCIMWPNEGPPMLPPGYNSNYRIVQGSGYVAILQEMVHDARIIALDGRPHLSPRVRQWFGDSRGRWEGDTLVVDTTNFTDRTSFRGSTSGLHVVERFTRVDAETILYRFTVDDPATWIRSWSAEIPMRRSEGPLFEYACHEGNYGLANILSAARAEEP